MLLISACRFGDEDVINGKELLAFFKKDDNNGINNQTFLELISYLVQNNLHKDIMDNQFQYKKNNNKNPELFEYSKLKEQYLNNDMRPKSGYTNLPECNAEEQNILYPNNKNKFITMRESKNNMNSVAQDNGSNHLKGNLLY